MCPDSSQSSLASAIKCAAGQADGYSSWSHSCPKSARTSPVNQDALGQSGHPPANQGTPGQSGRPKPIRAPPPQPIRTPRANQDRSHSLHHLPLALWAVPSPSGSCLFTCSLHSQSTPLTSQPPLQSQDPIACVWNFIRRPAPTKGPSPPCSASGRNPRAAH